MMLKIKRIAGFTLIELLVVITLIGILASAGVLINYPTQMKKARDSKRKADVEKIRSALEMYRADAGCYPNSLNFNGTTALSYTGGATDRIYLDPIPSDVNYSYNPSNCTCMSSLCKNFTLTASLEIGGSYTATPEGTGVTITTPSPTPTATATPTPTPVACQPLDALCNVTGTPCCVPNTCSINPPTSYVFRCRAAATSTPTPTPTPTPTATPTSSPTPTPTPIPTPSCVAINSSCVTSSCCSGLACNASHICKYSCEVYGSGQCTTSAYCISTFGVCNSTYGYPNSCVSSKPCCCVAGGGF